MDCNTRNIVFGYCLGIAVATMILILVYLIMFGRIPITSGGLP
jgi:hypothetical protein